MNNQQLQSNELDLQLNLEGGAGIQSRRRMETTASGAFLIEDVLEIKGTGAMTFVMCDTWLLELFELESGEYFFMRGAECVRPQTKRFGIFYPPFSIMRVCFKDVRGRWRGLAATASLNEKLLAVPIMFETDFNAAPQSVGQVEEILNTSFNRQSIEMNPTPSLVSIRAKKLIDENYLIHPAISKLAARIGVTHAHLTRQFKHDFGLTPSAYFNQLRIAAATFRLARGEEIINISQDVGYNDLSRFYKQFRKNTTKTPGYCQTPKRRKRT